jgi:hypothetical protein
LHFEINHEFDAPLDAVELAVLSPDLGQMMARLLSTIESVETLEHVIERGELRRVLRFQANAPLAIFKGVNVAREAMSWEEESIYRLAEHASTWSVAPPRQEWRRYFRSKGTYRLESAPEGRTRRTVSGQIEIKAGVLSTLVERMAIAEVRKTYDAEAETLRKLATL